MSLYFSLLLWVFQLLSVLLALLVVSHGAKKSSKIKDQPVNSDQNDGGPKTSSNTLVSIHRRDLEQENNYVLMEWEKFVDGVPKDAVSIREDENMYVCRNMEKKCSMGILKESKCEYEEGEIFKTDDPFEVLVNKDNFESLEWKKIKCTAEVEEVYPNAILICDDQNLFIGRKSDEAKSLPAEKSAKRKGFENFYPIRKLRTTKVIQKLETETGSCKVLTVSYENVKEQEIHDCMYEEGKKEESESSLRELTSDSSAIVNKDKQEVTQNVERSATISQEKRWEFTYSVTKGVKLNINIKAPEVFSMGVELSRQTTKTEKKGFSVKEDKTFKIQVSLKIPPKSQCKVRVVGQQVKIPFKAKLTRRFKRGAAKTITVSGTFVANNAAEVKTVIDECKPL
uniref:Uncharacterized protein n=1 Tax=Oryzias melastigma TaxID=30732 RepID=A0A3B3CNT1_ORYME